MYCSPPSPVSYMQLGRLSLTASCTGQGLVEQLQASCASHADSVATLEAARAQLAAVEERDKDHLLKVGVLTRWNVEI